MEKAVNLLKNAQKVVVLTGAGISAESGIPTFRGKDGLWKKFRAEDLATPEAFQKNPSLVWQWYQYRQELILKCQPNPAHKTIALMEQYFKDNFSLITQNVDNLHQRAGSKRVIEFHGNIFKTRCTKCNKQFLYGEYENTPLPRCPNCNGLLRPNVVWFGESLDPNILYKAFTLSSETDLFFAIGTSGVVYPAASLPEIAKSSKAKVIEVNIEKTPISYIADEILLGKAGEILPKLWDNFINEK